MFSVPVKSVFEAFVSTTKGIQDVDVQSHACPVVWTSLWRSRYNVLKTRSILLRQSFLFSWGRIVAGCPVLFFPHQTRRNSIKLSINEMFPLYSNRVWLNLFEICHWQASPLLLQRNHFLSYWLINPRSLSEPLVSECLWKANERSAFVVQKLTTR